MANTSSDPIPIAAAQRLSLVASRAKPENVPAVSAAEATTDRNDGLLCASSNVQFGTTQASKVNCGGPRAACHGTLTNPPLKFTQGLKSVGLLVPESPGTMLG